MCTCSNKLVLCTVYMYNYTFNSTGTILTYSICIIICSIYQYSCFSSVHTLVIYVCVHVATLLVLCTVFMYNYTFNSTATILTCSICICPYSSHICMCTCSNTAGTVYCVHVQSIHTTVLISYVNTQVWYCSCCTDIYQYSGLVLSIQY